MDSRLDDARSRINMIDQKMAELFEERMEAVADVAAYKLDHDMPIFDSAREKDVIERNLSYIKNEEIRPYYKEFLQNTMDVSKNYQKKLIKEQNRSKI